MPAQAQALSSSAPDGSAPRIGTLPAYGVDAPGVIKGFFAGALVLGAAGAVVATRVTGLLAWLAAPLLVAALSCLGLGAAMLVYAFVGKHRLRDHLLRQRAWRGEEVVLDIGAGRGLMAIGAAQRVPDGRVIALDIWSVKDLSGNTPDALLRNAAIERVGNVEIVTGDARRLDLPDASVDAVVSVFCIHNIEPEADRLAACREISRVLKVGGTVMIADFPGVGGYVDVLREAGLTVDGPHRGEAIGLGICGYLVAWK